MGEPAAAGTGSSALAPGGLIELSVDLVDFATCPEFLRAEFSHLQLCLWPAGTETFTASTSVATAQIALPEPGPTSPPTSGGAAPQGARAPA